MKAGWQLQLLLGVSSFWGSGTSSSGAPHLRQWTFTVRACEGPGVLLVTAGQHRGRPHFWGEGAPRRNSLRPDRTITVLDPSLSNQLDAEMLRLLPPSTAPKGDGWREPHHR